MFEIGFTLNEAREEARRCLECGPCPACKACVSVGIQPDLPAVKVDETLCSGCGVCVAACNYETAHVVETKEIIEGREVGTRLVSYTDPVKCKACGMCVCCLSFGRQEAGPGPFAGRERFAEKPGIVTFACKFGYGYCGNGLGADIKTFVPVICIGKVDTTRYPGRLQERSGGCAPPRVRRRLLPLPGRQRRGEEAHLPAAESARVLRDRKERVKVVTSFDPKGTAVAGLVNEFANELKGL